MRKIVFTVSPPAEQISFFIRLIQAGVFFLLFLQIVTQPQALAKSGTLPEDTLPPAGVSPLPSAYGKIIYSYNENSPKKLYIVAISHRNSTDCTNGTNTAKTQLEVYRIGEWLKQNRQLDILLPEGFFTPSGDLKGSSLAQEKPAPDNNALEKQLGDNSRYVNAEMLLMKQFQIPAGQIEDLHLYNAVLTRMLQLEDNTADPGTCLSLKAEISSLQEKRTAALLQKIPAAIEEEFRNGNISNENAMFTIGLNHIGTIINSLENNRAQIQSPPSPSAAQNDYTAELNLLKEGFGIIVIIPNTLIHDQQALEMTHLTSKI